MKKCTSMFLWENNKLLYALSKYRVAFHEYVDAFKKEDGKRLSELRTEIILDAPKVESALLSANIYPWMDYGSRAGGYRRMSITHELPEFVKNQFSTLGSDDDTLQKIDDLYLRAIGIYNINKLNSFFNIFNPFLYVNALVKLLLLPLFTLFNIKPNNQESGIWQILQVFLRIPAYYVTVIHPLILILGLSNTEKEIFYKIINIY